MTSKHPLARRIVIAFVLMTVIVCGGFSLGIVAVVHFVEQRLVSEALRHQLDAVLQQDLPQGRLPRLDSSTRFYSSKLPGYPIPESYADLNEGFSEVFDGDRAFHIYTRVTDGDRYLLAQEQSEFENREQALFNTTLAGFVLAVLGSWLIGRTMARKVMAPVSHLARQVRRQEQLSPSAPPLAPKYPDDEVGQLATAFDSTFGKLRQSLERERLFTSDVSHELRTPLTVIATSCEILQQSPLDDRQQELLQRVNRASEEMQELAQTFLLLARGQADQIDVSVTTRLAQVAERQCAHWGALIREKGLDFQCVTESHDDGRYNDTLLSSVMANLLRNALHYTDHGHVSLTLEAGGFRVEDSGAGIPSGQHDLIFQPFVRGPQARGEGLGLGLSLVKRICAHQGWQITVHNLYPQGSCFRVWLKPNARGLEEFPYRV